MVMKKLIYLLCAVAALVTGLYGCCKPVEEEQHFIDLRFRAEDSYTLSATGAKAFTILVVSTDPWTIMSEHPDWSIISDEEGDASAYDLVHEGKAEPTSITIQYYDNNQLDERVDKITIQSAGWVGKEITVRQAGSAFLNIPEADLDQEVTKAGGDYYIRIKSNQDWSARVTGGDWITISSGATGKGAGTVTVTAQDNASELRYAEVTIYDRHNEVAAVATFTQDGVQLVPAAFEIRAGYDQTSAELDVVSNTQWTVTKESASDDWFEILTPTGEGNGKIKISLTQNDSDRLRTTSIVLKNIVASADDFVAEKTIVIKQAYKIEPQRILMNNEEMGNWSSDWTNTPTYIKDQGLLFTAKARLNRSMPFGTYTFRWSAITPDPNMDADNAIRVRHWFCFGESCEIKADIRPVDGKVSFDFNPASDGNKPSLSGYTDVDFTQPIELTYKFDPSGAGYCHVTFLVNGKEAGSFDSSENLLRTVTWGAGINMYFGVDKSGSAVCEWYEYTAPMNWGE